MTNRVFPWGDSRPYYSQAAHFRHLFGSRIQKVAVNAGFTCPNRDGTLATGGCTFCNNSAFTPSYCTPDKSVIRQIDEGIEFHRRRYREAGRYLVYFQSFSNTYAPVEQLRSLYEEALSHPLVAGIIVGTRPDCIDEEKLDLFASLRERAYVAIEYGIESTYDATLRAINRGHDFRSAQWAVQATAERGIDVGAHFILGLPGESDEMLIEQTSIINSLPLTSIKFHQLQIFRGTAMADEYDRSPERFRHFTPEEYIDLVIEIVRRLRPDIVLERFASEAPPRYHHAGAWEGLRNETLWQMLEKKMNERGAYQGEKSLIL